MNAYTLTLRASAFLILVLTSALATRAQATNTYVSSGGSDANACLRTAPCKTFAGALAKTSAGGEITALDSGEYGTVSITKAVRITAVGIHATITIYSVSAVNGVAVKAGSADVVSLRGLTINGTGLSSIGIAFSSGGALHVENCVVNGVTTGISFAGAGKLHVKDTIVRNSYHTGMYIAPSTTGSAVVSIDHCRIENNAEDGLIVSSYNAKFTAQVTVRDSVVANNSKVGLRTSNPGAQLNVEGCVVMGNGTGVSASDSTTVRVSTSMVTNNTTGLYSSAYATLISFGNNRIMGNQTETSGTITVITES